MSSWSGTHWPSYFPSLTLTSNTRRIAFPAEGVPFAWFWPDNFCALNPLLSVGLRLVYLNPG